MHCITNCGQGVVRGRVIGQSTKSCTNCWLIGAIKNLYAFKDDIAGGDGSCFVDADNTDSRESFYRG